MSSDNSSLNEDENLENLNKLGKYNMPHKRNFRQHAHCNPLAAVSIPYPFNPDCVDWSLNYPLLLKNNTTNNSKIYVNTSNYPINYKNDNFSIKNTINKNLSNPHINILDVGCGYGGLLYNISKSLNDNSLALGMEIRDKVTNYVGEKIKVLRLNSEHKEYNNISVVKTNAMKLILNYFYKGQINKIFFCFADPHFKKYNHRKRIINKYLLNDYAYLLGDKGRLYIITDVKELFDWEIFNIKQNGNFRELSKEEIEKDIFVEFMKNTNEGKKVQKENREMWYSVFEKVECKIKTVNELYEMLQFNKDDD